VRQLAAAFEGGLNLCKSIDCNQGASKLAHSKGFTSGNNHAAFGKTPNSTSEFVLVEFSSTMFDVPQLFGGEAAPLARRY
jgi:hypothetical protein